MKNRELIANLNKLYALREREMERGKKGKEKSIKGVPLLIIARNIRSMEKEYNDNYLKDYQELREKFYVKKNAEVTIPADKKNGVEERKEKREIEVLRPNMVEEGYEKELNELLDFEVTVPIKMIAIDLLNKVEDSLDADAIEFMVDYEN